MSTEVNFDGIVGPTHNYSGLSYGNVPSLDNQFSPSNPKEAALQGLEKMKLLADMGFKQGVFPPHERPHLPTLRALGFQGTDADVIAKAYQQAPDILLACSSAAAMWTANAATVCPSVDSVNRHVHLTAANLSSKFHRSIESEFTEKILKILFKNPLYFKHHPRLPPGANFADEGAANHMRLCKKEGDPGVQLFIFGKYAFQDTALAPKIFPARQTYEASTALARLHQLYPERVLFIQQNPKSIDAGAFHNDVIAVSHRHLLLYHEYAFVNSETVIEEIRHKVLEYSDVEMIFLEVKDAQVPLKEAVASYLFNSQILSQPDGSMILIAPKQCQEIFSVQRYLEEIIKSPENPLLRIHYVDLHQSMRNGGGPACLRLRLVLSDNELAAAHAGVFLDEKLYQKLRTWIEKNYRDRFHPDDLQDPFLLQETQQALKELTGILDLGNIYSFQK
jgi:succinylarginine dihydrolase